ncbi:MAG: Lpg1974 family pore-forming outer membrane protein [Gemmataceae bacterium]
MRGRTLRGVWLLAAVLALAPVGLAGAQQYAPADPQIPLPYGSTRPEDGGVYVGARAVLYRQTNPLRDQQIAVRGLYAYDTGGGLQSVFQGVFFRPRNALNLNPVNPGFDFVPGDTAPVATRDGVVNLGGNPPTAIVTDSGIRQSFLVDFLGNGFTVIEGIWVNNFQTQNIGGLFESPGFVGSGDEALNVNQLKNRSPYVMGTELSLGYKFRDGSAVSLSWLYLSQVQQRAAATLAPQLGSNGRIINPNQLGNFLENTFLFSPVYNFPVEYAGADFKVNVETGTLDPVTNQPISVNPQTVFGLWNGASAMTISFRQSFQQYEITYREPIWETETYRLNGLVGPRYSWIWEKFKWTTTSIGQVLDQNNPNVYTTIEGPQYVGIYSNVTSNRMYGVHGGCEQEWYLGRGFAVMLKTELALFLDSVKEQAKYETAAKYLGLPENKRGRREWSVVPEVNASLGMMWYPTEFVQVYAGYDVMYFMNTIASPRPIDFNYGNIDPGWTHVNRLFDGWNAGLAITF